MANTLQIDKNSLSKSVNKRYLTDLPKHLFIPIFMARMVKVKNLPIPDQMEIEKLKSRSILTVRADTQPHRYTQDIITHPGKFSRSLNILQEKQAQPYHLQKLSICYKCNTIMCIKSYTIYVAFFIYSSSIWLPIQQFSYKKHGQ